MRAPVRIFLLIVIGLILSIGLAFAGDAGRESQFSLGAGARALGMGGGFVGLADDASAIYWNPAALSCLDNQEISLLHVTLFESSIYDVANYVYPHPKLGGFGFSFMRMGTSNIIRRQDWENLGEFSYSVWQMMFGYGRTLEGGYSIGSTLKVVGQTMDNSSSNGLGLDIAFYKAFNKNISVGVNFQDMLAPRLHLGDTLENIPMAILGGAAFKNIELGDGFRHNLALEFEKPENRSLKLHIGVESVYRNYLALRTGYDRDNLSFGFGIFYQRFRLDYAYKFMDGLTDSHRLGLSINIGVSVSEKIKREKELESARGSTLILDDRKRQFQFFKEIADKYYHNNSNDSAYIYYHRALAFNEDDKDSKHRISNIEKTRKSLQETAQKEMSRIDIVQPILDGYYSQAESFASKGAYVASLEMIDLALQASPDNPKFISLRDSTIQLREKEIKRLMDDALKSEKDGRYADALTFYNRILELSPNNTAVRQLISRTSNELNNAQLISKGMEQFTLGNFSGAKNSFEEALKTDPNNPVAKEYLDKILSLMKEVSELEDLQKDESVWKLYLAALEHFRNGDYEKAIQLWEEVLKYYPGNKNTINNIEQAKLRLKTRE
jgi:tetratricopeptide (TPR) repeat protein